MSLKTKANVISFYSYQLSTVFNVSVDKNEEAEMMLSNDESKVTVIFSVWVMLNKTLMMSASFLNLMNLYMQISERQY